VWLLKLIFPGQSSQSRRTLGRYPAMSIAQAREKAREWYGLVREAKRDPKEVEAERRAKAEESRRLAKLRAEFAAGHTFRSVAEKFIEARTNRRADADAREIRRVLIAAWGGKPITDISPRDVRQLIEATAKRAPFEARNAWSHAVLIFKRAVHDELIAASPCASLDKKMLFANVKLKSRDRVLEGDEIAALWQATLARGYPEGHAVRWLLLTGCRLGEALGARWREFHPELRRVLRDKSSKLNWSTVPADHKLWTIPPERFKSDATHTVPLTDAMCELLATVPVRSGEDLVWSHTGEHELGSLSKLKHWIDRHMTNTLAELARERGDDADDVTLPGWVMHDLRRVVRTNLSALGVADHVAEMVIGHGRRGLQRVYDQHRYLPQIREALTAWNNKLLAITKGSS
jgi:integrase